MSYVVEDAEITGKFLAIAPASPRVERLRGRGYRDNGENFGNSSRVTEDFVTRVCL